MIEIVQHPVISDRLRLVRDARTPTASFRAALRDIGLFLTYHVLRGAPQVSDSVKTPMAGIMAERIEYERIKLIAILRAGLGLLEGARDIIPEAGVGHIGFWRDESSLTAHHYYTKLPDMGRKDHILVFDPMIATGGSSEAALKILYETKPARITLICALCAPEGVNHLMNRFPDLTIVSASQDSHLNDKGFIMPGLGDAGDRLFAT